MLLQIDQLSNLGHQCAFIPGTRHLMITGGITDGYISDTTEIINVENGKWSKFEL